jgi:hypothetical protein
MANPKVEPPVELRQPTTPRVRAEAGHVVVTLELRSLHDPADKRDLELVLEGQTAATLGFELISASQKLG